MRQTSFFLASMLLVLSIPSIAQEQIEAFRLTKSNDGALSVYANTKPGAVKKVPYEKISGSPFYKDEYVDAKVMTKANRLLGKAPVKINLYTNEIYFLMPGGEEKVLDAGVAGKIVFSGENAESEIVFENDMKPVEGNNPFGDQSSFVQVLNQGEIQLLKYTRVVLQTTDSMMGMYQRYYFAKQVDYYISSPTGSISKVRKLSRSNLLDKIPVSPDNERWIKDNKIDFRKEEDVIKYFNYLQFLKKNSLLSMNLPYSPR